MFDTNNLEQPADKHLPTPDRRGSVTVTPLDLRRCRFRSTFRGFDRDEVTDFLMETASDYEQAVHENKRLREDMAPYGRFSPS
jgi:DivIVA domain-containing protein